MKPVHDQSAEIAAKMLASWRSRSDSKLIDKVDETLVLDFISSGNISLLQWSK